LHNDAGIVSIPEEGIKGFRRAGEKENPEKSATFRRISPGRLEEALIN